MLIAGTAAVLVLPTALVVAWAQQPSSSPGQTPFPDGSNFMSPAGHRRSVVSSLAPTGKLRVAINLAAPIVVAKDPATGELRGVAVLLGHALADSLGLTFTPVEYPNNGAVLAGLKAGAWDVDFVAVDPARMADMDFTGAYMENPFTYIVPPNSPIQGIVDVDRSGVNIVVVSGAASDLFLTRTLMRAQLIRVDTTDAWLELWRSGRAHAAPGNCVSLSRLAQVLPGSRVLPGNIFVELQAVAVPKGRAVGLGYLKRFVEQAKASGLVQQSITRAGICGVRVAPPTPVR